jgi:NAD(P)-dependent dehydrogenase (short-subunit alcohol dehydrogenase family)
VTTSSTVLITGSSRGIGRAMALAFARRGFRVGIHFRDSAAEAESAANDVRAAGGVPTLFRADVASSSQVAGLVSDVTEQWGRLDVLINNAGVTRDRKIADLTDDDWRAVLSVNLDGPFFVTRGFLPLMRKTGASIVNIASFFGIRPAKGAANYAASKAGLVALTKATAVEEARFNIRANAVLPGFHVTDMNRGAFTALEKRIMDQHLLGRLPDRTEMADFVFAVSQLSTVTGQVLPFESRLL